MNTLKLTPEKKSDILKLDKKGCSYQEIINKVGVSRESVNCVIRLDPIFPDFKSSNLGICVFIKNKVRDNPSILNDEIVATLHKRYILHNTTKHKYRYKCRYSYKRLEPEEKIAYKYVEKKRTCLKCNKSFLSYWSGNRICNSCRPYQPEVTTIYNTECIY